LVSQSWPLNNEERIAALEEELAQVQRNIALQTVEIGNLNTKMKSITIFYEHRVDSIYRRVNSTLREILGLGKIDTMPALEAENILSNYLLNLDIGTEVPDQVKRAVDSTIRPGVISAPLTLHGFRINRKSGREIKEGIECFGNEDGIVMYGPYKNLPAGNYQITAEVKLLSDISKTEVGPVVLDIFSSSENEVVGVSEGPLNKVTKVFTPKLVLKWLGGSIEIRVHNNSGARVLIKAITIEKV
jgi:hypothetical protein